MDAGSKSKACAVALPHQEMSRANPLPDQELLAFGTRVVVDRSDRG